MPIIECLLTVCGGKMMQKDLKMSHKSDCNKRYIERNSSRKEKRRWKKDNRRQRNLNKDNIYGDREKEKVR